MAMTDEERNRELAKLQLQVHLLNKVVAFLCCASEHRDAVYEFVERLDVPMPSLERELQQIIDDAREELLSEIAKNRKFLEQRVRT